MRVLPHWTTRLRIFDNWELTCCQVPLGDLCLCANNHCLAWFGLRLFKILPNKAVSIFYSDTSFFSQFLLWYIEKLDIVAKSCNQMIFKIGGPWYSFRRLSDSKSFLKSDFVRLILVLNDVKLIYVRGFGPRCNRESVMGLRAKRSESS